MTLHAHSMLCERLSKLEPVFYGVLAVQQLRGDMNLESLREREDFRALVTPKG